MKTHMVQLSLFHTIVFDMYLLYDSAHVFFICHAGQLQMDGNIFANVGYSRHSLRRGRRTEISPTASLHFRTLETFAVTT